MARPSKTAIVRAVLKRHPQSHAEALHINVARNTPAPLYRWLIASLLFSARIGAAQAEKAARALFEAGWTTPQKMAAVSWADRVKVLNRAGYARYDESTSRYIAETTGLLIERYGGDLRRLREAAEYDPQTERRLLKAFKGIGDVGADIFCREAQLVWDELYPSVDRKALVAARALGLGESAEAVARLIDRRDLPRLISGLVRTALAGDVDKVLSDVA